MPPLMTSTAGLTEPDINTSARFVLPLSPGTHTIMMRDFHGTTVGEWHVLAGRELVVDFLDPHVCSVDGVPAPGPGVASDFVPYPRMTLELDAVTHELVSGHPQVLQRHYNRPTHAAVYWGKDEKPDPYVQAFHKARVKQLRRLMRGVSGRVLDVGSGHTMIQFAGVRDIELFACDRDLDPVRWMCSSQIARAVVASADAVPFAPDSFDCIFAGEIVEHLVHPNAAVKQWIDMLRPGGRLIMTTPNREHVMARLLGRYKVVNVEHLFEWSAPELRHAVERAGGRVVRREGLIQAIPVWLPFKGWRDVVAGIQRRSPRPLPEWLLRAHIELGRRFPSAAANMAIVVTK